MVYSELKGALCALCSLIVTVRNPMAFDGISSVQARPPAPLRPGDGFLAGAAAQTKAGGRFVLSPDRLPFVGKRGDGQKSYWVMPALADGESQDFRARTYAAWYMIYAEVNGPQAARHLFDQIEREMPSRYPVVDRAFLREVMAAR